MTDPNGTPRWAASARDVVVVGGGPGGLAAAAAAAADGADTLLVEAAADFGRPVRTTGGSWPADLERFGLDASVWHPVRNCELWSRAQTVRFEDPQTVGCVLDVAAAWRALAERARDAGAELRLGTAGSWNGRSPQAALVGLRSPAGASTVRAAVAIDASGRRAALVRDAGLASPPERVGVGVEETIEAPRWDEDTIVLAVGDVAPAGYGWLFPEGSGRVRVGVGVTRPGPAATPLGLLHRWLENDSRLAAVRGGPVVSRQGGTIPILSHRPPPSGDRLIAVGDAAGCASLVTGEGIRYALEAGALAGKVAAEAAAEGHAGARFLRAHYARPWYRSRGRLLRRGDRLHERMVTLTDEQWDAVLKRAARLSPEEFGTFVRGDLSLAFLARLYWRTRHDGRSAERVSLGSVRARSRPAPVPARAASAAEPTCGCGPACACSPRGVASRGRGAFVSRVVEAMRSRGRAPGAVSSCVSDLADCAQGLPSDG